MSPGAVRRWWTLGVTTARGVSAVHAVHPGGMRTSCDRVLMVGGELVPAPERALVCLHCIAVPAVLRDLASLTP